MSMISPDTCCSIAPYFQVHPGKLTEFKALCEQFLTKTKTEEKCLYYGFSFFGEQVHCREAYLNAEGVLEHLDNVSELLQAALMIADLVRLEIHGCEAELAKLREPLIGLDVQFFVLESGFRRAA